MSDADVQDADVQDVTEDVATDATPEDAAVEESVDEAVVEQDGTVEEILPGVLAARLSDPADLVAAIEAILFVVDAPISISSLAVSLQQTTEAVQTAVETLRTTYDERNAGFEVREIAGGVRLYTRPEHADVVEHYLQDGQRSKLTQAALETLAVIAYRQPVTRARVSAIRGVNVDGVVRTLLARGLIVEVGNDPETGGGLFRTTQLFLEKMGLHSLDELPSLAPLLPDIDGLDGISDGE